MGWSGYILFTTRLRTLMPPARFPVAGLPVFSYPARSLKPLPLYSFFQKDRVSLCRDVGNGSVSFHYGRNIFQMIEVTVCDENRIDILKFSGVEGRGWYGPRISADERIQQYRCAGSTYFESCGTQPLQFHRFDPLLLENALSMWY
jgi:hypothetical protein